MPLRAEQTSLQPHPIRSPGRQPFKSHNPNPGRAAGSRASHPGPRPEDSPSPRITSSSNKRPVLFGRMHVSAQRLSGAAFGPACGAGAASPAALSTARSVRSTSRPTIASNANCTGTDTERGSRLFPANSRREQSRLAYGRSERVSRPAAGVVPRRAVRRGSTSSASTVRAPDGGNRTTGMTKDRMNTTVDGLHSPRNSGRRLRAS